MEILKTLNCSLFFPFLIPCDGFKHNILQISDQVSTVLSGFYDPTHLKVVYPPANRRPKTKHLCFLHPN